MREASGRSPALLAQPARGDDRELWLGGRQNIGRATHVFAVSPAQWPSARRRSWLGRPALLLLPSRPGTPWRSRRGRLRIRRGRRPCDPASRCGWRRRRLRRCRHPSRIGNAVRRSSRQRFHGRFSRGYFIRRYGVLRGRGALRASDGAIAVAGDAVVFSHDLAALRGRLAGWRAARPAPPPASAGRQPIERITLRGEPASPPRSIQDRSECT